jgi:hypothetical protein
VRRLEEIDQRGRLRNVFWRERSASPDDSIDMRRKIRLD